MANLLESVNRFRKLEEATAPKDDPAPVYLLDEIAEMARQSPESAQAIADAVQKKLGVKSPIVKFKALRVVKHLCTKGCSQFQRCMQRHASSVRELIHWRGEPDPFKGDVPNARVREFAKEVVEVMFNSTPVTNSSSTLAAQGRIQGFGSSGPADFSSTYSGIGSSNSARYGGFSSSGSGSLQSSIAAAQQAASQLTKSAQQALGEGPIAQGLASAANALGGFLQPQGYGSRLNESPYRESATGDYGYSGASSYAAPSVAPSQVLGSEEGLVDNITAPGGLRPLPDPADLRRFVDTASNMDGLRIAELLREKLESSRWQVVLRSLAALEAVLQRGSAQACGEIAVMFQSDPEPVRKCLQSSQAQVQQLAAAVLKLLTGEDVQVPAAAGAGRKGAAAAAGGAAASLMGDLLVDESTAAPTAAAAAAPANDLDLLGELMGPETAAAPAAGAAAAGSKPAAAAAAAAGAEASLFDGLGVSAAPSAAPPAVANAAAAAVGGDDLFGGLTVAAAPAAPAAGAAAQPRASAAAPTAAAPAAPAQQQGLAPLDELFSGLSTNSNTDNLLGLTSPIKQQQPQMQQQQQGGVQLPLQQQMGIGGGQKDLLGDLGVSSVQQQGLGMPSLQANGVQQQQQFGFAGLPQQHQQWSMGASAAPGLGVGVGLGVTSLPSQHQRQLSGAGGPGRTSSGSANGGAWKSHNTASEAAFDFVFDEFKKH